MEVSGESGLRHVLKGSVVVNRLRWRQSMMCYIESNWYVIEMIAFATFLSGTHMAMACQTQKEIFGKISIKTARRHLYYMLD